MPIQIDNEKIARFKQLVGESEKILILSHMNPDGDAVGSLLGMAHLLEKNISIPEKNLFLLLPHPCPTSFHYLEGSERIVAASVDMEACTNAFEEADLIIGVDFNSPGRTGILGQLLEEAKQPKILIDHHHNPAIESFNLIISYPDISSACELVSEILQYTGNYSQDRQGSRHCHCRKRYSGAFRCCLVCMSEKPLEYDLGTDLYRHV